MLQVPAGDELLLWAVLGHMYVELRSDMGPRQEKSWCEETNLAAPRGCIGRLPYILEEFGSGALTSRFSWMNPTLPLVLSSSFSVMQCSTLRVAMQHLAVIYILRTIDTFHAIFYCVACNITTKHKHVELMTLSSVQSVLVLDISGKEYR